ncbi:hypothetical protein [Mycobacterium shigaense]|uniref:hypothetical protein n=1 Tax=Mycobacterium shigaense TaxID=722731 RepID=UPI001968C028|nr:hypothetical protein [Mycobacterium shigaense]
MRAGLPGATLAEFFGTFVLLLLGLGTCALNVVGLPGTAADHRCRVNGGGPRHR